MKNNTLFRYITVETFEHMLKNRSIRFSPLDAFDDLEEGKSVDAVPLRRFVYASCWTTESLEKVQMWRSYTEPKKGLRIEMIKYPFKKYYLGETPWKIQGLDKDNKTELLKPLEEMFRLPYTFIFMGGNPFLFEVQYTKDIDKLYPKITDIKQEGFSIDSGSLGKYKSKHWDDQAEARYILTLLPVNMFELMMDGKFQQTIGSMLDENFSNPIDIFTLSLSDEAINSMRVTLSPEISDEYKDLVIELTQKYAPNIEIKDSDLKGKVKL